MEETTVSENFLGICLGGKKCKQRKKERQDRRKERRELRMDKRRARTERAWARTDIKKADADAKNLENDLLAQAVAQAEQPTTPTMLPMQRLAATPTAQPKSSPTKSNTPLLIGGSIGGLVLIGLILFFILK